MRSGLMSSIPSFPRLLAPSSLTLLFAHPSSLPPTMFANIYVWMYSSGRGRSVLPCRYVRLLATAEKFV